MFGLLAARLGRAVSVAVAGAVTGMSGGCAQLLGIDHTEPEGNSIELVRTSIGAKVVQEPVPLEGLRATYFVASGGTAERVDAIPDDQGRWTSRLHAPTPVEVTLPDLPAPIPRLYDLPSQHLQISFDVLGHPGGAPAPAGATFEITTPDTAAAMTDTFWAYVVGTWVGHSFAATPPTADGTQLKFPAFGFQPSESATGRPPDFVTSQDAFLILRYTGAMLTGVAEAAPFNQTEMITPVTTAAVTPVTPEPMMLNVTASLSTLPMRYIAVRPNVNVDTLRVDWALTASPAYMLASNAGPQLNAGTLMVSDAGLNVSYGNPFADRDWRTVLTVVSSESRTFMQAETMRSIALSANLAQVVAVPPPPGFKLTLPAGLPVLISLGGTLLSSDGQVIAAPTSFVDVSFVVDTVPADGQKLLYAVQVLELVPGAVAGTLERRVVSAAFAMEPKFSLPPETFQAGHIYTLRAIATLGGISAPAEGDLVHRGLPLAQGSFESAVIQVKP